MYDDVLAAVDCNGANALLPCRRRILTFVSIAAGGACGVCLIAVVVALFDVVSTVPLSPNTSSSSIAPPNSSAAYVVCDCDSVRRIGCGCAATGYDDDGPDGNSCFDSGSICGAEMNDEEVERTD